ncbi:MAG: indolepyruvate oxidoreductase subunit beta [Spirochaetes bacterium]|nr:indolepyruvate oxidoreductase subunit beta [Spirochaetota bacterium]
MKYDIILAGVGGQGVLSVAAIISLGAMKDGLKVKQAEVHGMAQRGGAVISHLRISEQEISSDLVRSGKADMILSMEPLESLRYLNFLKEDGILVTSLNPVLNIPEYPDMETIKSKINLLPNTRMIDANTIAKEAGSPKASNMALIGAASDILPIKRETLQSAISDLFKNKGEKVIAINHRALELGLIHSQK